MPDPHPRPALYVTFGLPGAGKTYAAWLFQPFGFHVHDGDDDLPDEMRRRIAAREPIDDDLRDSFFRSINEHVAALLPEHPRLVVAQTFIKEKYRLRFLERFPHARFVLVQAANDIRETRLAKRSHQPLDPEYTRRMVTLFEPPRIPHQIIHNDSDGDGRLLAQIASLLKEEVPT